MAMLNYFHTQIHDASLKMKTTNSYLTVLAGVEPNTELVTLYFEFRFELELEF